LWRERYRSGSIARDGSGTHKFVVHVKVKNVPKKTLSLVVARGAGVEGDNSVMKKGKKKRL